MAQNDLRRSIYFENALALKSIGRTYKKNCLTIVHNAWGIRVNWTSVLSMFKKYQQSLSISKLSNSKIYSKSVH